jgi:nitrate/nitrite transporter NarK
MATQAAVATVACGVLLAAPHIGPAAFWIGAAVWGSGGLGYGAVSMLAVMAEADEARTGHASGMVVFWFSLGFSLAPPLVGWSIEATDAYEPAIALLMCLYVAATAFMVGSRATFRPIARAGATEAGSV